MSRWLITFSSCLCVAVFLIGSSATLRADDVDADGARRARDAGKIAPLQHLFDKVERECRGRFVEMELDEDDGQWTYEIKLIGPRGDVAELEYDAADLRLLEAEGQHLDALECVPPGTPD
jgi:uncharacterized membrane protein YkoI